MRYSACVIFDVNVKGMIFSLFHILRDTRNGPLCARYREYLCLPWMAGARIRTRNERVYMCFLPFMQTRRIFVRRKDYITTME